jgi:hypothetical protein
MSEFDFTPIVCLVSLIVLTLYILRQVKVFHQAPTEQRIDQRLSDREMELTGPDYRDHVAPYFRKVSTRRQIVRNITGAD